MAGKRMNTSLTDLYTRMGAALAPDGIPLHFGDVAKEYDAALKGSVLLDRSHEGLLQLSGKDRFDLLDRMSTNDLSSIQVGQGKPTLFLNANGRILDRAIVFNPDGERLLILTGPGRGPALQQYIQRHIFFNDDAEVEECGQSMHQFALHGPTADGIIAAYRPVADSVQHYQIDPVEVAGIAVFVARLEPVNEAHWIILVPEAHAADGWQALVETHQPDGLIPSGGMVYHALRVRSGMPAAGFELTSQYIPLELGLWNEISFNKGCYTGQEIIARMESRERLARVMVHLLPERAVNRGDTLYAEGKTVGEITSAVTTPTGEHYAIGVIKIAHAVEGKQLSVGQVDVISTHIARILGVQPEFVRDNSSD